MLRSTPTRRIRPVAILLAAVVGCGLWAGRMVAAEANAGYHAALDSIDAQEMQGVVNYLAQDALEGREAGSRGGRTAGDFLQGRLLETPPAPGRRQRPGLSTVRPELPQHPHPAGGQRLWPEAAGDRRGGPLRPPWIRHAPEQPRAGRPDPSRRRRQRQRHDRRAGTDPGPGPAARAPAAFGVVRLLGRGGEGPLRLQALGGPSHDPLGARGVDDQPGHGRPAARRAAYHDRQPFVGRAAEAGVARQ